MQPGPARYASVSELYSTDEVALLLEEIRELEPTSCRGEDVLDCEIAGSGAAGAGGRSPAATERSWDSHAQYRRAPPAAPRALAPLYCAPAHLVTVAGALSLLVAACAAAACACVWAAVGLRVWLLPLPGRARLLLLAALSSALMHSALIFMHVTRLAALLPIHWNKLGMWTSVWSGVSLWAGGVLTLHALLCEPAYRWAPPHLANLLYSASSLGLGGGCASFAIVFTAMRECFAEHGRAVAGGGVAGGGAGRGGARSASTARSSSVSLRTAYRAVPTAPQPSTSRDNPL